MAGGKTGEEHVTASRLFRVNIVPVTPCSPSQARCVTGAISQAQPLIFADLQVAAVPIGYYEAPDLLAASAPRLSSVLFLLALSPGASLCTPPQCFNSSHWLRGQDGETVAAGLHRGPCRSPIDGPLTARIAVDFGCRVCFLSFSVLCGCMATCICADAL